MENPFEPREPGPFTARPRAPLRRGADYHLPPIGGAHVVDERHLRRQTRIGQLIMVLLLGGPVAYLIGVELGVW